ncbi:hypothetical protein C4J89_3144 [Pseudomonas sp. R4-35-07]|nr:hypothetical protein C4J89_3144 [Pseudomonas sp. R4-35-07]AZF53724.1 hypothetical protein C4J85_3241 [Pseudomonas sp. R4-34-07]
MNLASYQSEFRARNGRWLMHKEMGQSGCSGMNTLAEQMNTEGVDNEQF